MRYNKYAMPVHPEVLKRDFESDYGAEDDIKELMGVLVGKNDIRELNESEISFVREKIQSLGS